MKKIQLLMKWIILLVIGITTFAYAMFQGGFVSWFLFYATNSLILLTLIYVLMPIGDIEIERKLSKGKLVTGEDLQVTITISRNNRFPFFYFVVEDVAPKQRLFKNGLFYAKEIIYPGFKNRLVYSYSINQLARGEYRFSKVKIRTSDLLGIFKKEKVINVKDQVIVYPNFQQLGDLNMNTGNETEAYITSKRIIEDMTSVAGSREYVPGDRLTSIDWKVTARVNKLMTKEFEEFLGQRYFIAVDCFVEKQGDRPLFENVVELATSFVVHSYQKQINLGLLSIGSETIRQPIHYGQAHQVNLLEQLAKLDVQTGDQFDTVFVNQISKVTTDTTLVLITTRLTDEMVKNISKLKQKRVQVVVCFVNGAKRLTVNQQSKLKIISTLNVSYYIVGNDNFQEDLQRGEFVAQK